MMTSFKKWMVLLFTVALVCYASAARAQVVTNQEATVDELKVLLRVAMQQSALAQTVTNTVTNAPIVVHNFSEAVGAGIHYAVPSIDVEDAVKLGGGLAGLMWFVAISLRKLIPAKRQVNKFGLALAHLTEVNPTLSKLAAVAVEMETAKRAKAKADQTVSEPVKPA